LGEGWGVGEGGGEVEVGFSGVFVLFAGVMFGGWSDESMLAVGFELALSILYMWFYDKCDRVYCL